MKNHVTKVLKKEIFKHAGSHLKTAFLFKVYKQRRLIYLLFALFSLYFTVLIYAKDIESYITFPGMGLPWIDVSKTDLKYETIRFIDGRDTVAGIFIDNKAAKTIYYFHGNGGPIPYFFMDIEVLSAYGYNVAAIEYPGFAQVPGMPYEEKILKVSNAFFTHLEKSRNISLQDTVAWGYSLGAGPALNWAQGKSVAAVVLVSPFASRYDMAKKSIGFAFQKLFFLPNTFENTKKVSRLASPLLIFHGNSDALVPFTQGKSVWRESASNRKYFIELDDWGHITPLPLWGDLLRNEIIGFLETGSLAQRYYFFDEIEKFNLEIRLKVFSLDFDSDSSKTKYINNQIHFANPYHIPNNLVELEGDYVVALKGGMSLQKEALEQLNDMGKDFFEVFGRKLHIVSGYRSYEYQVGIKQGGCPDALCAKPGYSEHQSGLAVDLFEASSEGAFLASLENQNYFAWLRENAYKYGYHNTYQKGIKVDGYAVEPWHWRYVGVELATYLKNNDVTLAEFYSEIKNK